MNVLNLRNQNARFKRLPGFRFLQTFFLINVLLCIVIGYHYFSVTLGSKTLFVTTLYGYHNWTGKCLVVCFVIATYVGQLALLVFMPFALLSVLHGIFPRNKLLTVSAVLLFSVVVLMLMADRVVFSIFHFHMNTTILSIAFGQHYGLVNFLELSHHELLLLGGIALGVLVSECLIALYSWKRALVTRTSGHFVLWLASLGSMLLFSYSVVLLSLATSNNVFAQQTPNFPLYNTILASLLPMSNAASFLERFSETKFAQPLFPSAPLKYPLHALQCEPTHQPLNVLVIGIDTWRFDGLNKEMSPTVFAYAKKTLHFQHHFSGGNSTQAGLFSLFYGLPSSYWASMLQQHQGALWVHEMLKQHYQAGIFYSSDISIPPMNKTLFVDIPEIKAAPFKGATSVERDKAVTKAFEAFLQKRDVSRPWFSFLFYDSAHGYCQNADIPPIFPVRSPICSRMLLSKDDVTDNYHHYQNGVHFVDQQIASVLALLEKQHLSENTMVIITGDHGEEFNDSGQDFFGHGSNYTRYQVQTPLLIYWPGKAPAEIRYTTHHYDVVPTVMSAVLHCKNPYDDYSIGKNVLDGASRPYEIVGSYINMAIVQPERSITLSTSGNIRVADNQAQTLMDAKPDQQIVADALNTMQKFYQHAARN